jgi:hypothetical protein
VIARQIESFMASQGTLICLVLRRRARNELSRLARDDIGAYDFRLNNQANNPRRLFFSFGTFVETFL